MLDGIRLYANDNVWRKVLTDLGATVVMEPKTADLDISSIDIELPAQILALKSAIIKAIDEKHQKIINEIFGESVTLSRLQMQIIVLLHQSGGMSADEVKNVLGYSPDIATHTIDTAIYNLRKLYGRDFIQLSDGKYRIGKL
jgi:hypothetical protein